MKVKAPACKDCKVRKNSLFDLCSPSELENLEPGKTCGVYTKNQFLFHEGTMPSGLYCINEGLVKVCKIGSSGNEQILRIAKKGEFIGYRSLLSGTSYNCSAVIVDKAKICHIPKTDFRSLMHRNIAFQEGMTKMLCAILESAENRMTDIAYKPVRGRIAEALLLLNEAYHEAGVISMARKDLAGFVGTVKETAIRVISDFKSENLVAIEKRSIRILDPDGLARVSNLYD